MKIGEVSQNNQEIIGWLQILLKILLNETVGKKKTFIKGCHKNIAKVLLDIRSPISQGNGSALNTSLPLPLKRIPLQKCYYLPQEVSRYTLKK